jgi:MoaA/NifB/PqqE/SkfB family radical SAM enzyme
MPVVERFGRVLGEYRRETGDRVLLSWLGGEPLLWQPIFDVSRRLRHRYGIDISATTNGSTLHLSRTIMGIVDAFSELTFSVDGLATFHDEVRGSPGSWQRLQAAVPALVAERAARGAALKLRANVVLMRDNVDQFAALCNELAEWRVDEITFNQLGGRDRPEFFPDHSLRPSDVEKLRRLLPSLKCELTRQGVRLCGDDNYLQRIEASAWKRDIPVKDCVPGEAFLFIDECGRIAPCSFTSQHYGVCVDEINTVRDFLELPVRYRASRVRAPASACNDCPSTHVFGKFAS